MAILRLAVSAVGVVYGDIGTSPLYVYSTTFFTSDSSPRPSDEAVLGCTSMIIWILTWLLVLKYSFIVLRADDNGQGGAFALFSLLKRQAGLGTPGRTAALDRMLSQYSMGPARTGVSTTSSRTLRQRASSSRGQSGASNSPVPAANARPKASGLSPAQRTGSTPQHDWRQRLIANKHMQNVIRTLVVIGVGMILGDGVLTPSVSVLSAMEGLAVANPIIQKGSPLIIGLACMIITVLFLMQQFGTGAIGFLFSPIILTWLWFILGIGLYNIIHWDWTILRAISPHYWIMFLVHEGQDGWRLLGSIVLCITGAEALFADMGHFNRISMQISTMTMVYPCIMAAYLGQGAYLLGVSDSVDPQPHNGTFWKSLPGGPGVFWPMFIVALLAAIVASQALISAVFQIAYQAISQGFFPRFPVYHKSRKHKGQVYIPLVNYVLYALCILVICVFQTSDRLGAAYGLAVLADMMLTTHFMTLVLLTVWKLPLWICAAFYLAFAPIEATFWSSTLTKIPNGGWFSLCLALINASLMLLWFWGSSKKKNFFSSLTVPLQSFLQMEGATDSQVSLTIAQQKVKVKGSGSTIKRARGVGIYYCNEISGMPPVMLQSVSRLPMMYEVNIFLTNRYVPIPEVLPRERLLVNQAGASGFYHVIARYGYVERVRQGGDFVAALLDRVIGLLLKALQERLAESPTLRADLGFSDIFPVPEPDFQEKVPSADGSHAELGLTAAATSVSHLRAVAEPPRPPVDAGPPAGEERTNGNRGSMFFETVEAESSRDPNLLLHLEETLEKFGALPPEVAARHPDVALLADELRILQHARQHHSVVYLMGRTHVRLGKDTPLLQLPRRYLLEMPYKVLADYFAEDADVAFGGKEQAGPEAMVAGATPGGSSVPSAATSRPISSDGGESAMKVPLVPGVLPSAPRKWGFWTSSKRQLGTGAAPQQAPDAHAMLNRGSIIDKVKTGNWTKDADLEGQQEEHHEQQGGWWKSTIILAFQAIGVVYGDIGTSPLYVMSSTFYANDGAPRPSADDVVGVTSLIIWTIFWIVVIKYALIVLHADDNGQGGTFALFSLLKRQAGLGVRGKAMASDRLLKQYSTGPATSPTTTLGWASRSMLRRPNRSPGSGVQSATGTATNAAPGTATLASVAAAAAAAKVEEQDWRQYVISNKTLQVVIRTLVVIGVGMIMGDGVLTPAVSVVSAVEGLAQASPVFQKGDPKIVGISIAIIASLFLIQQFGTSFVGSLFSPIVVIWLLANCGIGLYNIIHWDYTILKAFSPTFWFSFLLRNGNEGWAKLGGVVLCITGAEALFADLGHFNRPAMQLSTLCMVFPCIIITYLGQGAYMVGVPNSIDPQPQNSTFWKALPGGQDLFWPMFIIATLAAIVASQALISAVFQIVSQAIVQNFFPRFHVYHTSRKHKGQVYIPFVNYLLMCLCIVIIAIFQTSDRLGQAYGIAVLADMLLTTHFLTMVMLFVWKVPVPVAILFYVLFAPVEATYWSATLGKVPTGGWFSLMMAVIYASIMMLWQWGSTRKVAYFDGRSVPLDSFLRMSDTADTSMSMTVAQQKVKIKHTGSHLKRIRGVGLYYSNDIHGVPAVLMQTVSRMPIIYEVNTFITNRFVPIPEVDQSERLLVEQLGVSGFYHVIARYGYVETVKQDTAFVEGMLDRIQGLLLHKLQEIHASSPALRHDLGDSEIFSQPEPDFQEEDEHDHSAHGNGESARGLEPLDEGAGGGGGASLADVKAARAELELGGHPSGDALTAQLQETAAKFSALPPEVAARHPRVALIVDELRIVQHARRHRSVVYVMGRTYARLGKNTPLRQLPKRYLLELPFKVIGDFFAEDANVVFGIPPDSLLEVGLPALYASAAQADEGREPKSVPDEVHRRYLACVKACDEHISADTAAEAPGATPPTLFEGQLSHEAELPAQRRGLEELLALAALQFPAAPEADADGTEGDSEPTGAAPAPGLPVELDAALQRELEEAIAASLADAEADGARPAGPPPAAKFAVRALRTEALTAERLMELGGVGVECCVCREELAVGESVQVMPCSAAHAFHPPCLKPWLAQHNSCPICRHELPTDDEWYERRKVREAQEAEDRKGAANAVTHLDFLYT
ncbi:hypothetical protein WJX81_002292 [Elliptochloris bilobata]|uniref:Potassium transporter n=1 Tax=Elliptochloris bilobata TaxID=381761 RepID=A0AAW1QDJ9_9CHLO